VRVPELGVGEYGVAMSLRKWKETSAVIGALPDEPSLFTTSTYPLLPGRPVRFPPRGGGGPGSDVERDPPPQPVNMPTSTKQHTRAILIMDEIL
jgi:hypothetical protein